MNGEVRGYLMTGECGHRRPIRSTGLVDPCACERPTTSRRPDTGANLDPVSGPDYLTQLCQAVEDLARSRYLLDQVIELAGESPELTDAELRDRLTALADRTRHRGSRPG